MWDHVLSYLPTPSLVEVQTVNKEIGSLATERLRKKQNEGIPAGEKELKLCRKLKLQNELSSSQIKWLDKAKKSTYEEYMDLKNRMGNGNIDYIKFKQYALLYQTGELRKKYIEGKSAHVGLNHLKGAAILNRIKENFEKSNQYDREILRERMKTATLSCFCVLPLAVLAGVTAVLAKNIFLIN